MNTEKRIAIIYVIILATIVGLAFVRGQRQSDPTKSQKMQSGCIALRLEIKSRVPQLQHGLFNGVKLLIDHISNFPIYQNQNQPDVLT
ncbi:MAG: hypothetical protein HYR67_15335 [Bacteroidetes bacterium]|nr:hypothetical protein [Bacteroidota bacterium]